MATNGWTKTALTTGGLVALMTIGFGTGVSVTKLSNHIETPTLHQSEEAKRVTIRQIHTDLSAPLEVTIAEMNKKLDTIIATLAAAH